MLIDTVLLVVILGSILIIGYNVFKKRSSPQPPKVASTPTVPLVDSRRVGTWLAAELRRVPQEEFVRLATASNSASRLVSESSGCTTSATPSEKSIRLTVREIISGLAENKINHFLGFPRIPCLRNGDRIELLVYDQSPDANFVQLGGSVRIREMLQFKVTEAPVDLLRALGTSLEDYLAYVDASARPSDIQDLILNVDNFTPIAVLPDLPLPSFMYTNIYKVSDLADLVRSNPSLKLIDVRSPAEFQKGNLPGSKNLPYEMSSGLTNKFSWNVTKQQISKNTFNFKALTPLNDEIVIVYGTGPADARPLYALSELFKIGHKRLGWVYDGIDSSVP